MRTILLGTITFFFSILCIHAQQIDYGRPQITPTSIDAASMMKAVNFPVSHMTGIPDITIPLYEIQVGDITLPISISYHASGLKPKEGSGRVGTGWTLNAEPSIAREIRGNPDESSNPNSLGWHYIDTEEATSVSTGEGSMEKKRMRGLAENRYDSEIDLFTYKLATRGGSFAIPDRASATTYPRSEDKINVSSSAPTSIESPDGLKYEFNNYSNNIEQTVDNFTTRWMCSKISSYKTKATVSFSYSSGYAPMIKSSIGTNSMITIEDKGATAMIGDGQVHLYAKGDGNSGFMRRQLISHDHYGNAIYPSENGTSTIKDDSGIRYYARETMMQLKIDKISFGENRLEFTYNVKDANGVTNNIVNIAVIDPNNVLLKTINLYISPYNSQTELTKLDSIIIKTPETEIKKYYFKYKDSSRVPSIHTLGIDHWGYANGGSGGSFGPIVHMVPDINTNLRFFENSNPWNASVSIKGANRETNYEAAAIGILTEITDPEGLKTQFEYEGNYGAYSMEYYGYKKNNNRYLYPVGGLRIKKITTEYGPNLHKYREFEYAMLISGKVPNGINDSINIMWGGGAIKHYVSSLDYTFRNNTVNYYSDTKFVDKYTFTHYNCMPYSTIAHPDGSPVHYELVTEKQKDDLSDDYIKTAYYYSVTKHNYDKVLKWDYPTGDYPKLLLPVSEDALRRGSVSFNWDYPLRLADSYGAFHYSDGRLLKTEEYKGKRNSPILKEIITSRTTKEYKAFREWNGSLAARKSVKLTSLQFVKPYPSYYVGNEDALKNEYEEYPMGISAQFGTAWNNTWYKWYALIGETTENYTYNTQEAVTTTPSLVVTKTKYEYKDQYSSHMNPVLIRKENSDLSISVDSMSYYDQYPSILLYHSHEKNKSKQESKIVLNTKGITHKVQSKTTGNESFTDEVIYHEYDDYGNVAHISGKDGRNTCYIWSYNGQYPIAEIDNITYTNLLTALNKDRAWIKYLCDESVPSETSLALINSLRDKLPTCFVSTYTYKPNYGLTSVCEPNGFTTYYKHDAEQRLKEVYIKEGNENQTIRKYNYSFYSKLNSGSILYQEELYTLELKIISPQGTYIYPSNQKVEFVVRALGGSEEYDVEFKIGLNREPFIATEITNTCYSKTANTNCYTLASDKLIRGKLTIPDTTGITPAIIRFVCTVTDRKTNKTTTVSGVAYASPTGKQPPAIL